MQHAARALLSALGLVGWVTLAGGCTRVPELGTFTSVLGQQQADAAASASAGDSRSQAPELTLDHLQLKGSHNSYHRAPRFSLVRAWKYSHSPIEQQLSKQGVRHLELDVRYQNGEIMVGHLPLIDGRVTCRTLRACLQQLRTWSRANPSHLPIFVFLEPKEDFAPSSLDGRLEALDYTINSVFSRAELITPEDVVGDAGSLHEAINTKGWPTVASTRGRVAFALFGPKRHLRAYSNNRPRLEGRTMFAAGEPGQPHAAVVSYDDPVAFKDDIARALREHMLVRTRADADLVRDVHRRNAALASGAHFIGSDFVDPRNAWLELGDRAPVRCNPKSAPQRCNGLALREIEQGYWAGLGAGTPAQTPLAPAVAAPAASTATPAADAVTAPADKALGVTATDVPALGSATTSPVRVQ